jgi:hypothetical protein
VTFDPTYHEDEPARDEIAQTPGLLLLEFGANWCGHCQAITATVKEWTNADQRFATSESPMGAESR